MQDEQLKNRFSTIEPITKGWSNDMKYFVKGHDGVKHLLRISPVSQYDAKKELFELVKRVAELDIPISMPVEFGTCKEGVYTLHSWIDGEDAETALVTLPEAEQYALGVHAGEILRKIHTLPAPATQEDWYIRFNRKTDMKIQKYRECGLSFSEDHVIIDYLEQHKELLQHRPQSFQHGDYHIGNMMIEDGALRIIDFDRYDFGDPWEEFNRIAWCAAASPHFATGRIHGYFQGEPPIEFFKLLAFYISSNTLSSIYWAMPFGQDQIDTMMKQAQHVLSWFDNMRCPVPTWYFRQQA